MIRTNIFNHIFMNTSTNAEETVQAPVLSERFWQWARENRNSEIDLSLVERVISHAHEPFQALHEKNASKVISDIALVADVARLLSDYCEESGVFGNAEGSKIEPLHEKVQLRVVDMILWVLEEMPEEWKAIEEMFSVHRDKIMSPSRNEMDGFHLMRDALRRLAADQAAQFVEPNAPLAVTRHNLERVVELHGPGAVHRDPHLL